ncbi:MAG: hypothetical protein QJT81_07895 [Candidatus Thiothrix putei]|uniref:Uncharacterized protein n=1 Tax=Candidatus Thiothrix putei TaxID=3080811 RepID=A0AA95KJY6_9GAMM|nr:MAG: hypothetical protein QJT81_07895 [Candidatus Thiothrix putei]
MKLSTEEADLFFKLMWTLQFYVKQELGICPELSDVARYKDDCSLEDKSVIRQAVYDNSHLIDKFVTENPSGFTTEELAIVSQWKGFLQGDFYIERFLKKHTIFVSYQTEAVYGVQGLYEALDEMFYPAQLPALVKAVLLPFKGKIVYDGLLHGYNVSFGRGISGNIKDAYLKAKQNNRIIDSFDVPSATLLARPAKKQAIKDWQPEIRVLQAQAKQLKAGDAYPALYSPVFSLVKMSLDLAEQATADNVDKDALYKMLRKMELIVNRAYKLLEREDD